MKKTFKYTGIIYTLNYFYVDNNCECVYPSEQEKLLEEFKPVSERNFYFVEICNILGKVHVNRVSELSDAAYNFVKDNQLSFDYVLLATKNNTKITQL